MMLSSLINECSDCLTLRCCQYTVEFNVVCFDIVVYVLEYVTERLRQLRIAAARRQVPRLMSIVVVPPPRRLLAPTQWRQRVAQRMQPTRRRTSGRLAGRPILGRQSEVQTVEVVARERCDKETQTDVELLLDSEFLGELVRFELLRTNAIPADQLSSSGDSDLVFGSDFDVSEGEFQNAVESLTGSEEDNNLDE